MNVEPTTTLGTLPLTYSPGRECYASKPYDCTVDGVSITIHVSMYDKPGGVLSFCGVTDQDQDFHVDVSPRTSVATAWRLAARPRRAMPAGQAGEA